MEVLELEKVMVIELVKRVKLEKMLTMVMVVVIW